MPLGQVHKHLHLMNQMNSFKGPLKETFNFKNQTWILYHHQGCPQSNILKIETWKVSDYDFTDFTMPSQSQTLNSQDHFKPNFSEPIIDEDVELEDNLSKRIDNLEFRVRIEGKGYHLPKVQFRMMRILMKSCQMKSCGSCPHTLVVIVEFTTLCMS